MIRSRTRLRDAIARIKKVHPNVIVEESDGGNTIKVSLPDSDGGFFLWRQLIPARDKMSGFIDYCHDEFIEATIVNLSRPPSPEPSVQYVNGKPEEV